jgi:hypothetical protein
MLHVIATVLALLLSPAVAPAQTAPDRPAAGVNRETGAPGSAGPKDDGVVQHGAQPNPGEVRPGSRDGDSPSASAGSLREESARRVFGLPVTAALLIGAVIVAMLVTAGILIPSARRRDRARGNGTYGPPS